MTNATSNVMLEAESLHKELARCYDYADRLSKGEEELVKPKGGLLLGGRLASIALTVATVWFAVGEAFSATVNLVWTGLAGDSKFTSPGNWATAPSKWNESDTYTFDLTAVPANAEIVNDTSLKLIVGSITLGVVNGTVTLSGGSSKTVNFAGGTWTVPAGTKLKFKNFNYDNAWGKTTAITLSGGGEIEFGNYGWTSAGRTWTFDNISATAMKNFNNYMGSFSIKADALLDVSSGVVVKVGKLSVESGGELDIGSGASVQVTGGQNISTASSIAGTVKNAGGTMSFEGNRLNTIAADADLSAFSGTLQLFNSSLQIDGAANLGSGINLQADDAGRLSLANNATLASLSGEGVHGGVVTADGTMLTVNGLGAKALSIHRGRISGGGGLTLDAPDSTQVLAGENSYEGATVVKRGTLVVGNVDGRRYPAGLSSRWSFDGSDYKTDSGPDKNDFEWTTYTEADPEVRFGGVTGGYLHFPDKEVHNGIVTGGATSLLGTDNDFTIVVWCRPDKAAVEANSVLWYGTYSGGSGPHVSLGADKGKCLDVGGIGWIGYDVPARLVDGAWHQIVVAQSGQTRTLYVDGAAGSEKTESRSDEWGRIRLGCCDGWGKYQGDMDEILVFSRCLSADEIKDLYDNPARVPMTEDLVATLPDPDVHWDFNDETNIGKDVAGGGADLVFSGSPTVITGGDIMGSAVKLPETAYAVTAWTSAPQGMPTGDSSWTLTLRLQDRKTNPSQGAPVFAFGDWTTAGRFFSVIVCSAPRRYGCSSQLLSGDSGASNFSVHCLGDRATEGSWDGLSRLTCVYDANEKTVCLYSDGVLKQTLTDQTIVMPDVPQVYVNRNPNKTDAVNTMCFDDVRIYRQALNADQVRALAASYETGVKGPVLPVGSPVTIESGATFAVSGGSHPVKSVNGSGNLTVEGASSLTLRESSAISGAVSGQGDIVSEGRLMLSGDGSKFGGSVCSKGGAVALAPSFASSVLSLAAGSTITLSPDGKETYLVTPGTLTIAKNVKVAFSVEDDDFLAAHVNRFLIADAGTVVGTENLETWSLASEGLAKNYRVRFTVEEGKIWMRLHSIGLILIFR